MACAECWTPAATWPWAIQTGRCHADLGFILLVCDCTCAPSVYHRDSMLSGKQQSMQCNHSSTSLSKTSNRPFSGRTRRPAGLVYYMGVAILALLSACGGALPPALNSAAAPICGKRWVLASSRGRPYLIAPDGYGPLVPRLNFGFHPLAPRLERMPFC